MATLQRSQTRDRQYAIDGGVDGVACSYEAAQLTVLMDIRDELQRLNELLHCHNFTGLPAVLRRIDRRLAMRRPLMARK